MDALGRMNLGTGELKPLLHNLNLHKYLILRLD